MATITVNDQEIEVKDGVPLLQALLDAGIYVPHFCYHQDLPVDGNCRQCLVEMETPKGASGVISCATPVGDGMIVRTDTEAIEKARRGVLEYLLVNHPVDCPVCDQAGECRLQQSYMNYGFHQSRVNVEKVHKNKTLQIGERVMLDQERCVLCRRCIRFCDHVSESHELAVGGRGDHSYITTFPGHKIDNKYSVNTVDVCPVGALTDTDFRFKCRVWFLKKTDTICHGCSRGCNASFESYNHNTMDELNGTAFRLKPRRNPEVNKSWMCDEGRLLYQIVNENRIHEPRLANGKSPEAIAWEKAFGSAAEAVSGAEGKIAGICSPDCTNEELFLFRRFLNEVCGSETISAESLRKPGYEDDILLRADKHPNSKGVDFQGPWNSFQEIIDGVDAEDIKVLVVLRNDFLGLADNGSELGEKLAKLDALIVIDSNHSMTSKAATVLLPTGTFAERAGSYVNFEGRIQRTFSANQPRWEAKTEFEVFRTLAAQLEKPFKGSTNAARVWQDLAESVKEFEGIALAEIGNTGTLAKGYETETAS
ncbi:MAG: molybdopterin-dependent oxidoreductase [Planctomycetota bacterium]|jgi:NADH-quinone oxidoreductase subunit G|nr:molybdopterin-dependent oxidoreductase [Planctomycetota bacterium]MDP7248937.1 molybdopterin-dependent oxidoreductase [Planctomycetota bacterium]